MPDFVAIQARADGKFVLIHMAVLSLMATDRLLEKIHCAQNEQVHLWQDTRLAILLNKDWQRRFWLMLYTRLEKQNLFTFLQLELVKNRMARK